jgi:hypothetical protein
VRPYRHGADAGRRLRWITPRKPFRGAARGRGITHPGTAGQFNFLTGREGSKNYILPAFVLYLLISKGLFSKPPVYCKKAHFLENPVTLLCIFASI